MDAIRLAVLRAEIQAQLDRFEEVMSVLEDRYVHLTNDNPAYIESVAYQLHNLYNAVEDLMQIVAKAFENNVEDFSRWHTQLIDRLTLDIEGIRPALFTTDTARVLHKLRAFRHFFRHAYGMPLDSDQINQNVQQARRLRALVLRDARLFLGALEPDKED